MICSDTGNHFNFSVFVETLWPTLLPILENVTWAAEKNVYSVDVEANTLDKPVKSILSVEQF
jgi:hypothetical protein